LPTSPDGTIDAVGLWKRFRADRQRGRLLDELARIRHGDDGSRWRWALRDVGFHVDPGESVGLVGANGSGKSTLLKVLTGVMYPHAGRLSVAGRVGALIEVVSGIHHELTGRENLFLYGSLMGLPRSVVAAKFDELVAFAELEDAIDRQVKYYSLGMQMRLGFSVAAFLDADVLLVDEVLAVGDSAFQHKCLDRMREVITGGTTLVLVSHDLAALEATCRRGVWMRRGAVTLDGPIGSVLDGYRGAIGRAAEAATLDDTEAEVRLISAEVRGPDDGSPRTDEPLDVTLTIWSSRARFSLVGLGVSEGPAAPIWVVAHEPRLEAGTTVLRCRAGRQPLPRGRYTVWACVAEPWGNDLVPWHPVATFDLYGPDLDPSPLAVVRPSPVYVPAAWNVDA
jgi:ABC-type polysaccharide/polyol phosphate transport system ATPase subunit